MPRKTPMPLQSQGMMNRATPAQRATPAIPGVSPAVRATPAVPSAAPAARPAQPAMIPAPVPSVMPAPQMAVPQAQMFPTRPPVPQLAAGQQRFAHFPAIPQSDWNKR